MREQDDATHMLDPKVPNTEATPCLQCSCRGAVLDASPGLAFYSLTKSCSGPACALPAQLLLPRLTLQTDPEFRLSSETALAGYYLCSLAEGM
jgi:hypothetical protein